MLPGEPPFLRLPRPYKPVVPLSNPDATVSVRRPSPTGWLPARIATATVFGSNLGWVYSKVNRTICYYFCLLFRDSLFSLSNEPLTVA
jgi:hypothetical protein